METASYACSSRESHLPGVSQSKIPRLSSTTQSKIPVPASAAKKVTPTVKPSYKARLSFEKKGQVNVIKPRISKKSSLQTKEVTLKVGPKTTRKRKSLGSQKRKSLSKYKQSTLCKNADNGRLVFKTDGNYSPKNTAEKENISPGSTKKRITPKNKLSHKDLQQGLDIDFQPNEYCRQLILSNTELPFNHLRLTSPVQKNKPSDAYEIAMARIQELSAKKLSLGGQSGTKMQLSSESKKSRNVNRNLFSIPKEVSPASLRRCTWTASSQTKGPRSSLNSYDSALTKVERRSCMKLSLCGRSPENSWNTLRSSLSSPNSRSPLKFLDAYEMAMQRIHALKSSKQINPKFSLPFLDSKQKQSSIYRPLQTLLQASGTKKPTRLTDISEKSEYEASDDSKEYSIPGNVDDLSKKLELVQLQSSSKNASPTHSSNNCSYGTSKNMSPFLDIINNNAKENVLYKCSKLTPIPPPRKLNHETTHIHTPRPLSFYSKSDIRDSDMFVERSTASTVSVSHCAPICTPLVLQNIARHNEDHDLLDEVKVKLDFDQKENQKINGITSRVNELIPTLNSCYSTLVDHVPTKRKQDELLADKECEYFMAKQTKPYSTCRNLRNPLSVILSSGDDMHFVTLSMCVESP